MKENGTGSYRLGRRQFLAASALASAGLLLSGCRPEAQQASQGGGSGGSGGNFPDTPEWNFVFICHVTTNSFFVPTQYGIEDAQALLGTTSQWTGSEIGCLGDDRRDEHRHLGERRRHRRRGRGPCGFQRPDPEGPRQGHPCYRLQRQWRGPGTNPALCTSARTFQSGVEMGKRIVSLVDEGSQRSL